jgi:hypothetical protein
MKRTPFLLIAFLSLVLPSCNSVSLGGSEADGGTKPGDGSTSPAGSGGHGGTGGIDAPLGGQGGGGTTGTGTCGPRDYDADCVGGATIYTCVQRGGKWVWDYRCPEFVDGGPGDVQTQTSAQHPYVSTGAACIDYPTPGYRSFPEDPSIQETNNGESWPRCTRNCKTPMPVSGAYLEAPLDQALPAGPCDDEGATCGMGANAWCGPCANVAGPYNGYTCMCRGHNWHCAVSPIRGMNMCGQPTCIDPSFGIPPNSFCSKTTWTDTQVCACGVCRDLCDSDAQCPSGHCKLNQVCGSSQSCQGSGECLVPCRGLCEPTPDGGTADKPNPVDAGPAPGCDVSKAAQALSAAGITTVGEAQTLNEDLPASLSAGANWGVKNIACSEGGYDLSPVAGKTVCLVSYDSTSLCQQLAAKAWVVMSEGTVRCIYQSAALNPGVYSVHDASCTSPDAGTSSCPGSNPAQRTCRSFANECIPTSCTCGGEGSPDTWRCTTDCRTLSLCADGGAAEDAGACSGARIDNATAATAFAQYERQLNPALNPATTFSAEEKTVPSLWDTMQAQLFFGKVFGEDGTVFQEVAFLYRQCNVTPLTDDQWFGLIQSGVVLNGALYYSWEWGSGISRTSMGKMAPVTPGGPGMVKITSVAYLDRDLVLVLENEQLAVYQAVVYWGKFNEWESRDAKPTGSLKDYGDRLAVVDENGKELSTTLP